MLHFADRTVRDDAHRHVNARQQFVRSCDVRKFGIKQTCYFCAVNVLGIGLDHRHALFFTDDVDDFVEFYAFKTGKNLFQVNVNAKFPEHRDIGARANDLAIDQRTVAVEKYRFYLGHVFPLSLV